MALISNQNLNFISAKQILFMYILFRERVELDSAAPFALKKMSMLPRSNLCWRYYKHLQFLPPKHSLPYTYVYFSCVPDAQVLRPSSQHHLFYPQDPCSFIMSRNMELAERASGLSAVPWRVRRLVITAFFCLIIYHRFIFEYISVNFGNC